MTTGLQSEPPKLTRGPRFLRDWSAMLADWCKTTQPLPGIGTSLNETPAGRVINARGKAGTGGSASAVPFEVINATEGATKQVRIRLGILKSDGEAWLPTGMFLGDEPPLIMATTGTAGYVYLIVTVDGDGDTTGVSIGVGITQPADSTTAGHLTLGTYGEDGSGNLVVTSQDVGAQAHIFCGIEHHFAKA